MEKRKDKKANEEQKKMSKQLKEIRKIRKWLENTLLKCMKGWRGKATKERKKMWVGHRKHTLRQFFAQNDTDNNEKTKQENTRLISLSVLVGLSEGKKQGEDNEKKNNNHRIGRY